MCSRQRAIGLRAAVMCSRLDELSEVLPPKRVFDAGICSLDAESCRNRNVLDTAICSRISRLDDSLAAICSRL